MVRELSTPESSPTEPLSGRFVDEDPTGLKFDNAERIGPPFDFGQDEEA